MSEEISFDKTGPSVPEPVNIYPFLRKTFFVLCILFFLGLIVFLIYYNGKSIYANGL